MAPIFSRLFVFHGGAFRVYAHEGSGEVSMSLEVSQANLEMTQSVRVGMQSALKKATEYEDRLRIAMTSLKRN